MDFTKQMFFDGGMGTMLQQGFTPIQTHRQYIESGADIITTNTFGIFDPAKIQEEVSYAKQAIKETNTEGKKLIAFDIAPTGKLLEPYGDTTYDECYNMFLQAAEAGAKAGVDFIIVETMQDIEELKAAVTASISTGLPVAATMTFDKDGRTMMGVDLRGMTVLLESLRVAAIGMNCGFGPELYEELVPQLAKLTNLPIIVQPNAGLPELVDGKPTYNMTPEAFANHMSKISAYANILGGCCGTTPAHIREMVSLCRG